ncbi:hypothetical protein ASG58_01525 [Rhizobium sp. Leaf383]|nr:hypothetical protein ASG58_01525 [Rhizobium sp. Leaf383]
MPLFQILQIFLRSFSRTPSLIYWFSYWFPYRVTVQILDTAFAIFWTRLGLISGHGFVRSVSSFWTRLLHILPLETGLEWEPITCRFLPPRALAAPLLARNQPGRFKVIEVNIQRRARQFTVVRKRVLAWEAPMVRMEAITQVPEHNFCGRLQASLLDSPIGCVEAHSAASA